MCVYNEIQWNSFMKWSLSNLRLKQLSWDILDLSILEKNSQLGTWIQVLFIRRGWKSSLGLQHQNVSWDFVPKSIPRVWGFYYIFGCFVCLFGVLGEMLLLYLFVCFVLVRVLCCCCSYCLLGCFSLFGCCFGFVFLGVFFWWVGWVLGFLSPLQSHIYKVQAGLKYSLFLCAPFLNWR